MRPVCEHAASADSCLPFLRGPGVASRVSLLTCLVPLQSEQTKETSTSCHPSAGQCGARRVLERALWPWPLLPPLEDLRDLTVSKARNLHKQENDHPWRSPVWSCSQSLVLQTHLPFLVFERTSQFFLSHTSVSKIYAHCHKAKPTNFWLGNC